jgi:hypothetical protein
MSDIAEKVTEVNAMLKKGEPHNISTDDFTGWTGYKPQFIWDALNAVCGFGNWGFEEISSEVITTQNGNDKPTMLAIAQVKVWLKDVDFQPMAWGQANVTRGAIGDAKKGAVTDAIKKSLSYFSIGNRAFYGLLPKGGGK